MNDLALQTGGAEVVMSKLANNQKKYKITPIKYT
jgi:hypothetical protein